MNPESISIDQVAGSAARARRLPLSGPIILPANGRPPREVIVYLHGLASNGEVIEGLRARLQSSFPRALIAAPNAPELLSADGDARQWWPHTNLRQRSIAAGVKRAVPALQRYLDALLAAASLGDDRLVLVGFSQGAMLALHAGLTRRRKVAAVLAYSGMLAARALPYRAFGRKPRIMLMYGLSDPIIPAAYQLPAGPRLAAYGCPVRSHVRSDLGHAINGIGYALGVRFIRQALGLPLDEAP